MAGIKGKSGRQPHSGSWAAALDRAMMRESKGKGSPRWLEIIADRCVAMAADGDLQAMKELGDRVDGKPRQAVDHTSSDKSMSPRAVERTIIDPNITDTDS